MLKAVHRQRPGYVKLENVEQRYQLDPRTMTGEEYLHALASKLYRGNLYSAADRLMSDFRKGHFGPVTLEVPLKVKDQVVAPGEEEERERRRRRELTSASEEENKEEGRQMIGQGENITIGKGQFEGW